MKLLKEKYREIYANLYNEKSLKKKISEKKI